MKDIVAHLTGWNRSLVARLRAALRGEPESSPPWPAQLQTDDEINAWIDESRRGGSVCEVLEESQQVLQELLSILEGLPDEARIEPIRSTAYREYYFVSINDQRFPAGEFFDHFHDDHEPDVRAWLEQENNQ